MPPFKYKWPGEGAARKPSKAARKDVAKVLHQIADEASAISLPHLRALAPVLEAAQKEVAQDLKRWLATATDGDLRFTAQRYRSVLLQLRRSMQVIGVEVTKGMEGTLAEANTAAGAKALDHLEEQVAVFSKAFGHSVRPLTLNHAAIMAKGDKLIIPRIRTSAARYTLNMRRDIRRQLAIGMVRNETIYEMTSRLVRQGGPRGLVSLSGVLGEPGAVSEYISEGLFKKHRHWGERVVRTETMNAYNVHHVNGLKAADEDDPGYMKRWDASADRKLCAICYELDGEVVALDDAFSAGVQHPPVHPNDRCGTTPWRKEWGDEDVGTVRDEIDRPPGAGVLSAKQRKAAKAAEDNALREAEAKKAKAKPKAKKPATRATRAKEFGAANEKRIGVETDLYGRQRFLESEHLYLSKKRGRSSADRARTTEARRELHTERMRTRDPKQLKEHSKAENKVRKLREAMPVEERADMAAKAAGKAVTKRNGILTEDWREVRRHVDGNLQAEGFTRRETDTDLNLTTIKTRRYRALGLHWWNGRIDLQVGQFKKAKQFGNHYSTPAKAKKTRADLADLGKHAAAVEGAEDAAAAVLREADKVRDAADAALNKRAMAKGVTRAELAEIDIERRVANYKHGKAVDKYDEIITAADNARAKMVGHPGLKVVRSSEGMSTIVHESLHGHGALRSTGYQGAGKLVEEVSTEMSARKIMSDHYGIPTVLQDTGGSYGWLMDPLTKSVGKIYELDPFKARRLLEDASIKLKKSSQKATSSESFVDLFVGKFPAKGRKAMLEAVNKIAREDML